MDERVRDALANDRTIDITTIGRTSGLPRRIETWFYRVDDQIYLTGSPGRRDWYANLLANPGFTFHLKQSLAADLPARASPITDRKERRAIFQRILSDLGGSENLQAWLEGSPLMAVHFDESRRTDEPVPDSGPARSA
jgi:deazaflavin-dependent oxidoreductase (nitroreductase family)